MELDPRFRLITARGWGGTPSLLVWEQFPTPKQLLESSTAGSR